MQVEISCRHGSISNNIQDHVKTKSEKLLNYFERVTRILVTFTFEGPRVRTEILVDAEHKHNFVSHHDGEESLATFEQAFHKMEHQIKKYKEKIQDHKGETPMGGAPDA